MGTVKGQRCVNRTNFLRKVAEVFIYKYIFFQPQTKGKHYGQSILKLSKGWNVGAPSRLGVVFLELSVV